jgi:hypothetical protein
MTTTIKGLLNFQTQSRTLQPLPSRGPHTLPNYVAQAPEERPKLGRSLPYTTKLVTGTWKCLAFTSQ